MQSDFVQGLCWAANPIEHHTAATIYLAVAVSADPGLPADALRNQNTDSC
jgi:hypothetical protein